MTFLCALLCATLIAQGSHENPDLARCRAIALEFLVAVGQKRLADLPSTQRREEAGYRFTFGPISTVNVDAKNRRVVMFDCRRPTHTRSGYVISNSNRALKRAEELRMRLNIPKDYLTEGVRVFDGRSPNPALRGLAGLASGSFGQRPFGYPFLSYGNQIAFTLDRVDGAVLSYFWSSDSVVESSSKAVNESQARAAARKVQPKGASLKEEHKLGFVLPNGLYTSEFVSPKPPYRVRLAYEFQYSGAKNGSIWVDAGTGKILGGWMMKHRSE